jgi:hypothetical protein
LGFGEIMPLIDPNGTDDATEKITVPIYTERVLVSREIVQIGQVLIRKEGFLKRRVLI